MDGCSFTGADPPPPAQLLREFRRAQLTLPQLWLRCFELGGTAATIELDAYLHELLPLTPLDVLVLTTALEERHQELCAG